MNIQLSPREVSIILKGLKFSITAISMMDRRSMYARHLDIAEVEQLQERLSHELLKDEGVTNS